MAEQTILVFAKSAVTITRVGGAPTSQGDVIGNALNGDAFSWETPYDLQLTFGTADTAISFDDANGLLQDDPFQNEAVTDQKLTQPLTINGTTYTPSTGTTRWASPAPVNVENEYEVTLYSSTGVAYRMVGVSVTQGYSTSVVGVMFDGPAPPPGTTLYYRQGVSSYSGTGQTATIPQLVVCFLAGTMIETPSGPRRIDDLRAGDLVLTLDSGPRPVRWIGRSRVDGRGALAPIRIAQGALGNRQDLFVSPNHRILLQMAAAELNFGFHEVLVPAKFLVNGTTLRPSPRRQADYLHLLLDTHEMVYAEGIASESLFTGPMALAALSAGARAELAKVVTHHRLVVPQRINRPSLTQVEFAVIRSTLSASAGVGLPSSMALGICGQHAVAHE